MNQSLRVVPAHTQASAACIKPPMILLMDTGAPGALGVLTDTSLLPALVVNVTLFLCSFYIEIELAIEGINVIELWMRSCNKGGMDKCGYMMTTRGN